MESSNSIQTFVVHLRCNDTDWKLKTLKILSILREKTNTDKSCFHINSAIIIRLSHDLRSKLVRTNGSWSVCLSGETWSCFVASTLVYWYANVQTRRRLIDEIADTNAMCTGPLGHALLVLANATRYDASLSFFLSFITCSPTPSSTPFPSFAILPPIAIFLRFYFFSLARAVRPSIQIACAIKITRVVDW